MRTALAAWLCSMVVVLGQVPSEQQLFEVATRAFQDRNYEYAEKSFAEFAVKFPMSERWPEATARQGQARFELKNYEGVVELLKEGLPKAGALADEFQYWIGQAQLQRGNFSDAAEAFGKVVQGFPGSKRRLDAAFGESVATFRRGDLRKAAELITAPASAFQHMVGGKAKTAGDVIYRGYLLAAEAWLGLSKAESALESLLRIEEAKVPPDLAWQREHAVFRAQLALSRTNLALRTATNLVAVAREIADRSYLARSHSGWGGLLEAIGDFEGAAVAFTNNLVPGLAEEYRREAVGRFVAIRKQQTRESEAAQFLERWLGSFPEDRQGDFMRVQLADLNLAAHWKMLGDRGPAVTNGLAGPPPMLLQSMQLLDRVLGSNTNSPNRGQALWLRGWCRWALSSLGADTNAILSALVDFEQAAPLLETPEDRAVARFKAGDCALLLGEPAKAAAHYGAVVLASEGSLRLRNGLLPQALFQQAEAAMSAKDSDTATRAVERLLREFPKTEYGDRGMLQVGQALAREGKPSEGRRLFERLIEGMPSSPLLPEVKMAVARSYVREGKWAEAVTQYDRWLAAYTNHPAAAAAEFDRAWLTEQAGDDAKATAHFAGFVARFPKDPNAARAYYWLGNRAFNMGSFVEAETHYQSVASMTNAPAALVVQSKLAAGRAAFARLGYAEARAHFASVVDDPRSGPGEVAEALFALGDAFMSEPPQDPAKPLDRFAEAIKAFNRIAQGFHTNALAPMAWTKIGHCHLQLASVDAARYEQAALSYTNGLSHALADLPTRCEAEYGLGQVREKLGQLNLALERFSNIFYGRNLKDQERADPVWIELSGSAAARVAEAQKNPALVAGIYQRLIKELPEIAPALRVRQEKAMERMSGSPRAAAP